MTRSDDLVYEIVMKSMPISEFKAKCIAVLKHAQRRGEPLVITLRGRPLARIEPLAADQKQRQLGTLRHLGEIKADIVNTDFDGDWEGP